MFVRLTEVFKVNTTKFSLREKVINTNEIVDVVEDEELGILFSTSPELFPGKLYSQLVFCKIYYGNKQTSVIGDLGTIMDRISNSRTQKKLLCD